MKKLAWPIAAAEAVTIGCLLFGPQIIATVLVAIGAAIAWSFVALYWPLSWKRSDEGRHLMGFTLMVAIILTLAIEVRVFGPYPGIQVVAVALYGWLVWLLGSRVRLLWRAQHPRKTDTT